MKPMLKKSLLVAVCSFIAFSSFAQNCKRTTYDRIDESGQKYSGFDANAAVILNYTVELFFTKSNGANRLFVMYNGKKGQPQPGDSIIFRLDDNTEMDFVVPDKFGVRLAGSAFETIYYIPLDLNKEDLQKIAHNKIKTIDLGFFEKSKKSKERTNKTFELSDKRQQNVKDAASCALKLH